MKNDPMISQRHEVSDLRQRRLGTIHQIVQRSVVEVSYYA